MSETKVKRNRVKDEVFVSTVLASHKRGDTTVEKVAGELGITAMSVYQRILRMNKQLKEIGVDQRIPTLKAPNSSGDGLSKEERLAAIASLIAQTTGVSNEQESSSSEGDSAPQDGPTA